MSNYALKKSIPSLGHHDLPKTSIQDYKIVSTHLIDGVYEGFVNSSYQRDGFGMLQTEEFDTYIGFFKYNKIHGIGLIVYRDGSIIYGQFSNGKLSGIALTDNRHELQLGVFAHNEMKEIGFEYIHDKKEWRMNRYHKGVSI